MICRICQDEIDTRGNGIPQFFDADGELVAAHEDCADAEGLVAS